MTLLLGTEHFKRCLNFYIKSIAVAASITLAGCSGASDTAPEGPQSSNLGSESNLLLVNAATPEPVIDEEIQLVESGDNVSANYSEFIHEGLTRTYQLYKPENLSPNRPLVVILHTSPVSNNDADALFGFNTLADQKGFMVLYAHPTINDQDAYGWNYAKNNSGPDDVSYVKALTDHIKQTESVNSAHLLGFKQGASMAYAVACQFDSRLFNRVAMVHGLMEHNVFNECSFLKQHRYFVVAQFIDPQTSGSLTDTAGVSFASLSDHITKLAQYKIPVGSEQLGSNIVMSTYWDPDGYVFRDYQLNGLGLIWPTIEYSDFDLSSELMNVFSL